MTHISIYQVFENLGDAQVETLDATGECWVGVALKRRRVDCGAGAVDRISNLPKNLIDLILGRLPLHDAARTTVLSKTWRNIWETHPHLVFDDVFFSRLVSKKVEQSQQYEVSTTINNILLLHTGPVIKFHLSIPRDLPLPCTDLWIKKVSRSGMRILELSNEPLLVYKMPSYLFPCLELTHLSLDNCLLNPPPKFGGFRNLIDVKLVSVINIISADMSFGTQLETLNLEQCIGIEHLGSQFTYNKNLWKLLIIDSEEIDWRWFECTKKLKFLSLTHSEESSNSRKEVISLDKLLGNMPEIIGLYIYGFALKCSKPGASVLKRLKTMEKMHTLLLCCAGFCDLVQIQCVLGLIRSSPNLQYLYIAVEPSSRDGTESLAAGTVEQYLQLPNFVNMILNQLETVDIWSVNGSKSELHFIKLLLASSTSLRWMKLSKSFTVDPKEELRILREVTLLPRASTTAQIVWT